MALKPSLVEWKHRFTKEYIRDNLGLETFLSGMETVRREGRVPFLRSLKPSLVEWKQLHAYFTRHGKINLETFLVE